MKAFLVAPAAVTLAPLTAALAQTTLNSAEADLLKYSAATITAGLNNDSAILLALTNFQNVLANVVNQNIPIQMSVRAQVLDSFIKEIEQLLKDPNNRHDRRIIDTTDTIDLTLYAHFWGEANLPAGIHQAYLNRLTALLPLSPGSGVTNELKSLISDINNMTATLAKLPVNSDIPSIRGIYNPAQEIVSKQAELTAAFAASDDWTKAHLNKVMGWAQDAPALNAIPATMTYFPDNSDLLARTGIALATRWQANGAKPGSDLDRAKQILLSFINGFHATEPGLIANSGLDFASSIPSFVYLFELLSRGQNGLSPAEGALIADKFSLIAERIQQTAYGSQNNLDPAVKAARLVSNIRTWQNSAVLCAALASGRQDLVTWALGSDDPTVKDGGLRFHLREGFGLDHLIKEGPFGYQAYDAAALAIAGAAAQNAKIDLSSYQDSRIQKIFLAMIQYTRAKATPDSGDGGQIDIRQDASLFAMANRLYGGHQNFSAVMKDEQSIAFRSWSVLHESQAFLTTPVVDAKYPDPVRQVLNLLSYGLFLARQFLSYSKPGTWTDFQAPDHRESHQKAQNLAITMGNGDDILSGGYDPGTSVAYRDSQMNQFYWRSFSANILHFLRMSPLGSAEFDENGARSLLTDLDDQDNPSGGVHFARGTMPGGYGGQEIVTRAFIQNDGPGGRPGYRLVATTAKSPAVLDANGNPMAQPVGEVWHGPRGSIDGQYSLTFAPAVRDASDATLKYVTSLSQASATNNVWTAKWTLPGSNGLRGSQFNFLPSSKGRQVTLGTGPEGAPYLKTEDTYLAGEDVAFQSAVVIEDFTNGNPALVDIRSLNSKGGTAVFAKDLEYQDWNLISDDPMKGATTTSDDASESMQVLGAYGRARIIGTTIDLVGQVTSFTFNAPGITTVRLNGQVLDNVTNDGSVVSWSQSDGVLNAIKAQLRRAAAPVFLKALKKAVYRAMPLPNAHLPPEIIPRIGRLESAA